MYFFLVQIANICSGTLQLVGIGDAIRSFLVCIQRIMPKQSNKRFQIKS